MNKDEAVFNRCAPQAWKGLEMTVKVLTEKSLCVLCVQARENMIYYFF